ncbi:MFS transporter [Miltoncostaea marina]|uniref:MFS transporter n=1 Tax=Miltoncostaea marina TaxID=2843215 RepID=UPI001C3D8D60|nr:MFS transporter [Miltoncostaea marina]
MWGIAASFYVVALFHRMSLGVASLDAQRRFDLGPDTIAALSALQLGLYLLMTIPAGLAADRVGPRMALAFGMALMAVGEVAFGLATSAPLALGGRALVGVGDAFIFLSVLRIAQNWFPARRYPLLAALTGMAGAIGQLGTTVPLGLALDGAGWTATFVVSGVVTGLLALACLRLVADRPADAGTAAAAGRDGDATAPATGAPAQDPIMATLRRAWATSATRAAFWTHFALMGPFVTITALWGYPWLVEAQSVAPGTARAWLLVCVAAFGLGAPVVGLAVARAPRTRGRVAFGAGAAATAGWALALLWPGGHPPAAVILATLVATGVGGAAAMLAFDVAREGNPAHVAGSAGGLANTGGFSAAVATQLLVGWVMGFGPSAGLQTALLPMLGLTVVALAQMARHGRRRRARARVLQPAA